MLLLVSLKHHLSNNSKHYFLGAFLTITGLMLILFVYSMANGVSLAESYGMVFPISGKTSMALSGHAKGSALFLFSLTLWLSSINKFILLIVFMMFLTLCGTYFGLKMLPNSKVMILVTAFLEKVKTQSLAAGKEGEQRQKMIETGEATTETVSSFVETSPKPHYNLYVAVSSVFWLLALSVFATLGFIFSSGSVVPSEEILMFILKSMIVIFSLAMVIIWIGWAIVVYAMIEESGYSLITTTQGLYLLVVTMPFLFSFFGVFIVSMNMLEVSAFIGNINNRIPFPVYGRVFFAAVTPSGSWPTLISYTGNGGTSMFNVLVPSWEGVKLQLTPLYPEGNWLISLNSEFAREGFLFKNPLPTSFHEGATGGLYVLNGGGKPTLLSGGVEGASMGFAYSNKSYVLHEHIAGRTLLHKQTYTPYSCTVWSCPQCNPSGYHEWLSLLEKEGVALPTPSSVKRAGWWPFS